jgi:uncharacterized protein
MDISGQYRIVMPREAVWQALMDPRVLSRCVPGCEALEQIASNQYRARIALIIGPVRAKFDAELELLDLEPHKSYRLSGSGRGGPVGFGEGRADVLLEETEAGVTILSYTAGFQVGGRLAQLGSRLVLGTTRKLVDDFFAKLVDDMNADSEKTATQAPAAEKPAVGRRALVLASIVLALLALLIWWLLGPGTAAAQMP